MSISAIGGSNAFAIAALQKQLQADQKALAADQVSKAGQQILVLDQAKIALDSAALAAAQSSSPAQAEVISLASGAQNAVDLYL